MLLRKVYVSRFPGANQASRYSVDVTEIGIEVCNLSFRCISYMDTPDDQPYVLIVEGFIAFGH